MPDVHLGKGATVGSVFASKDFVCPNAVGVDIGCGMCAVKVEGFTRQEADQARLEKLHRQLLLRIPTGFDSHEKTSETSKKTLKKLIEKYEPTPHLKKTLDSRHERQLGTLGGGNHFIELVYDETDQVWMMLHSGSRNIGNITATHYDRLAGVQSGKGSENLAYLALASPEGQAYLKDMEFCQGYALENRASMMLLFAHSVRDVFGKKDVAWKEMINIHHNYCQCEACSYVSSSGEVKTENLWVTRKGATSAKEGELGIIPGSMSTGSFITRGKGQPLSWASSSHGAGRKMSRAQARVQVNVANFKEAMKGIVWDQQAAGKVIDEAPEAYKDLSTVMRNQSSLVEIVHRLKPLMNMKGY